MSNLDQDEKDQSTNSGTDNSSAVTVEFLRARLLSERSVSRSARQRADELSKRVVELEEQLRIVHVQRTKAEKATADVLAILESNGINEVSDAYDSSSDHDIPSESNLGDRSLREEESSADSKVRKNDSEEISGSDVDYSSVLGRSLSWKVHKDSPHLLENFKDPNLKRRSSFASVGSSPKHRQGKSCRQIRRKESRSVSEDFKASPVNSTPFEKEGATGPKISTSGDARDFPDSSVKNENKSGISNDELGEVGGMEKALKHQSQLINQFEEMEKTQREWEEKFREQNNCTPDFCDPGNRSDVTEERFEVKAQAPHTANTIYTESHSTKSEAKNRSKSELVSLPRSHDRVQPFQERGSSSNGPIPEFVAHSSSLQEANGKQHQRSLANTNIPTSPSPAATGYHSHSRDSRFDQSAPSSSSNTTKNVGRKPSANQNESYALVPRNGSNQLESVLDALKQAKQSLQQKLTQTPLVEGGHFVGKSMYASLLTTVPESKVDVPIGCAGLFRLPTDLPANNINRSLLRSSTQPGFESSNYPNRGVLTTAGNHFAGQFLDSRPSFLPEHRYPKSRDTEGSPISSQTLYLSPYSDLMPQMPSRGVPTFTRSRTLGTKPADNFSLLDDPTRQNMYS